MAVLAMLWFHFCTAIGWFPAALNLFLPTAIGEQSSRGQLQVEDFMQTKHGSMSLLRQPPCSLGHLMLPKLAVPANSWSRTAANSWSF